MPNHPAFYLTRVCYTSPHVWCVAGNSFVLIDSTACTKSPHSLRSGLLCLHISQFRSHAWCSMQPNGLYTCLGMRIGVSHHNSQLRIHIRCSCASPLAHRTHSRQNVTCRGPCIVAAASFCFIPHCVHLCQCAQQPMMRLVRRCAFGAPCEAYAWQRTTLEHPLSTSTALQPTQEVVKS